jgi:hypothetical protein
MSYRVTRDQAGRPQVLLNGEPPYSRALDAAVGSREPELARGRWLVLAFPAWSVPGVAAIGTALDTARRFGGSLQLGIRPFDDPEEHRAWQPGIEDAGGDPVWVVLQNGIPCLTRSGHLTEDELVASIDAACGG